MVFPSDLVVNISALSLDVITHTSSCRYPWHEVVSFKHVVVSFIEQMFRDNLYIQCSYLRFSFIQRVLANPSLFKSIEEDFLKLQESRAHLQSPNDGDLFETSIEQLIGRWQGVKHNIEELHPRIQIMADNFSDYKDKLQLLVHWVQGLNKVCRGLDNVQDYLEFQPLMENFQVPLISNIVHLSDFIHRLISWDLLVQ